MEDISTNKVAVLTNRLSRFGGKDTHAYRDWKAQVEVHMDMYAPGIYDIFIRQPNPTVGGNLAQWRCNNAKASTLCSSLLQTGEPLQPLQVCGVTSPNTRQMDLGMDERLRRREKTRTMLSATLLGRRSTRH